MRKWYDIKSKADKAEVWIYDQIGEDFWTGDGVTAKSFQKEFAEIRASQIDLHINSPGGSVFDGVAIYNLILNKDAEITTYIDGLAASIASVIALAGDRVVMAANALYMIHNPSGVVMGTSIDMREFADRLDKIRSTMTAVYQGKTNLKEEYLNDLMDSETWLTAPEALNEGFIDEIGGALDMAANAKFDPIMEQAGFKRIPQTIAGEGKRKVPSPRDLERILRDGGCSGRQAKAILSEGLKGYQRDVDPPTQRDVAAPEKEPDPVVVDPIDEKISKLSGQLNYSL